MTNYAKWSDTDIIWVSGGIDSYGAVIGHAWRDGEDDSKGHHTAAEKATSSWRWDVGQQCFMNHAIPPKRRLTSDEWCNVQNWLVKNGFSEDDSFRR